MTIGFNHVATFTPDLDRYIAFYEEMFDATVVSTMDARSDHPRMAVIEIGGGAALNAFEVPAETIVGERTKMGGRGPIDHFAIAVSSREELEVARNRLVTAGSSPGEVTDFGSALSVFFRDPDGMELEVVWRKRD
jgi:catechol 2,3-dioxygenase-like lactoylglutathione lyase family enzyme